MPTMYCTLCCRPVEAKRQIGIGSVVLAFVTGGLSLLAIPFYKKRCPICTSAAVTAIAAQSEGGRAAIMSPERLADMEHRLQFAESELEATTTELHRVRAERDFYRQLLGDPAKGHDDARSGP